MTDRLVSACCFEELLETEPDYCLAPEQIEKLVASWMSGHHAASMFASLEQPSALGFPG